MMFVQRVLFIFANHFKESNDERPRAGDLQFQSLFMVEGSELVVSFNELEVKNVVCDCDSIKSPGPDGLNFGFIKDFWVDIKDDVMRSMSKITLIIC